MISLISPHQAQLTIAKHLRQQRIAFMYTQQDLSDRSGVSLAILRKFERGGVISLESLLKLAVILGLLENVVKAVAPNTELGSIDEMLALKQRKPRQRVRK